MNKFDERRKQPALLFVEHLTVLVWILHVVPYLIFAKNRVRKIYYIDASSGGIWAARLICGIFRLPVEELKFQLVDVHDEDGNLLRLRIATKDMCAVRDLILQDPEFQPVLQTLEQKNSQLATFLEKQAVIFGWMDSSTMWRMLFLVNIVFWKARKEEKYQNIILFAFKRRWMKQIKQYALEHGVVIKSVWQGPVSIRRILIKLFGEQKLRCLFYRFCDGGLFGIINKKNLRRKVFAKDFRRPLILTEYFGHLNLDHPESFSDLFFVQQSGLPPRDMLVLFHSPDDPVDENKFDQLSKRGFNILANNPRANVHPQVPLFHHLNNRSFKNLLPPLPLSSFNPTHRWFRDQVRDYHQLLSYWMDFFSETNVKVYVSWWKFDSRHCVITDAIKRSGGVSAIYQRSFEEQYSPEFTVNADVVFGFSPLSLEMEKKSRSKIPYYVITGLLGDHRANFVEKEAQTIREKLHANGAQRILAFFDENSGADSRWHTGHEFMRVNYEFLFKKIMETPWLGVIFKPKVPQTLRKRLGPVLELMESALRTGRCFIFEKGKIQGSSPPVAAAKAADIAVHGHLCAATAGIESAMAGVPTLLLDREGWPMSILNGLGNNVVFKDWESLWKRCCEHWETEKGISGFGQWGPMIDRIDPFHDGRAAERMGTYLQWIIEGFKAGLGRETVLADAAQRYAARWGKENIDSINC